MPNTDGVVFDGLNRAPHRYDVAIYCECGEVYRSSCKVVCRDGMFYIHAWKACPHCMNSWRGIRTEVDPPDYDIRRENGKQRRPT